MRCLSTLLVGVVAAAALTVPAHAANIITFADNPGTCGGAVMCIPMAPRGTSSMVVGRPST